MKINAVSHREERLNTISHALGAIFGFIGLFLLLTKNGHKSIYATESIVVYSVTFVLMFVTSALYHGVSTPVVKQRLRVLDHICIYLLIAGTYTPIALVTLLNGKGWTIFYSVWAIAGLGTILKLFFTGKFESISLLLYLAMGWLIVVDFDNVVDYVSPLGVNLLFAGGAFYTFGIIFYTFERIRYNHFIWHIFVLGGALCHWAMIYLTII